MIAFFNEPVQVEYRPDFAAPWRPGLWLGIAVGTTDDAGVHYGLVVGPDGTWQYLEEPSQHIRTMWRWDPDLQDWQDTGLPAPEPADG